MNGKAYVSEEDLHAFIDGELDEVRFREIAELLESDPSLAERVESFQCDKNALKRLYGPLVDLPLREEWLARAQSRRRVVSWRIVGSIAATILLLLGGLSVFRGLQVSPNRDAVDVALMARDDTPRPQQVIVVAVGNSRDYEQVVQQTVGARLKLPDLQKMGYRLQAIRLFREANPAAAELVYRQRDGGEFTLYLTRSDGTARYDQFERNGMRVCIWKDEVLSAVMAGRMSTATMQRLASLAYTGLTL